MLAWPLILLRVSLLAPAMFLLQVDEGLGITAMGRDVLQGLDIAQLTFLAGVAASAVMVVRPSARLIHLVRPVGCVAGQLDWLVVLNLLEARGSGAMTAPCRGKAGARTQKSVQIRHAEPRLACMSSSSFDVAGYIRLQRA